MPIAKKYDVVEIDPFGSPVPHLYHSANLIHGDSILSITATDTAVLCGAHANACIKNYQAKPLDNECCHELAVRILIGKIARELSSFNFGIEPLFSLSDQHYLKVIVRVLFGAEQAVDSIKKLGFALFCSKCGERKITQGFLVDRKCVVCKSQMDFSGPLWSGNLWNKEVLEKMISLNKDAKISKLLSTMLLEVDAPALYYDVHKLCKRAKAMPPKLVKLIGLLKKKKFVAVQTHFRENSIRTDASAAQLLKILRSKS